MKIITASSFLLLLGGALSSPRLGKIQSGTCRSANITDCTTCGSRDDCYSRPGHCFCDIDCQSRGDCCSDIKSICARDCNDGNLRAGCCQGRNRCYAHAGRCYCDFGCGQHGDCCHDVDFAPDVNNVTPAKKCLPQISKSEQQQQQQHHERGEMYGVNDPFIQLLYGAFEQTQRTSSKRSQ